MNKSQEMGGGWARLREAAPWGRGEGGVPAGGESPRAGGGHQRADSELTRGSGPRAGCPPQCWRPGFNPWVAKILWRRAWQPSPVILPRESSWTEEPGGLESVESHRVGH